MLVEPFEAIRSYRRGSMRLDYHFIGNAVGRTLIDLAAFLHASTNPLIYRAEVRPASRTAGTATAERSTNAR
jgi:hypothetical protein